jgi:gas vesicle protein
MSNKRSGLSLLFGTIIGALTALLFSPLKGKDFREKIKKEIKNGKCPCGIIGTEFKDMVTDIKDSYNKFAKTDEAKEMIKKGKNAFEQVKSKGKEIIENVSENIENIGEKQFTKKSIKKSTKKTTKK